MAINVSAQDVALLSAGAVEPGLRAALALYDKKVSVTFNTAPQIRERIEKKGEKFDVVIVRARRCPTFRRWTR